MRIRWLMVVVVAFMAVCGSLRATAQEASPTGAECVAPALPPGSPTPPEEQGPPAGSPAGDEHEVMEMGTPEAGAAENEPPAAAPFPAGTPADEPTAAEVIAGVENIVACNNGNAEGLVALFTPTFMLSEFGSENPYDVLVNVETTTITVDSVGDAQTHDDGRVSAEIAFTGLFTPNTVLHMRWYLVEDGEYLKLDQWQYLPIEDADVQVEAEMVDYAFNLSQTTFETGQTIAFNVVNAGAYPHEMVIVRLPEGVTFEQVMSGEVAEDQIQFLGFTFAGPGQETYLGLTGLEAGTYTLVCFIDTPGGIPHVARGMVAEITVA